MSLNCFYRQLKKVHQSITRKSPKKKNAEKEIAKEDEYSKGSKERSKESKPRN